MTRYSPAEYDTMSGSTIDVVQYGCLEVGRDVRVRALPATRPSRSVATSTAVESGPETSPAQCATRLIRLCSESANLRYDVGFAVVQGHPRSPSIGSLKSTCIIFY